MRIIELKFKIRIAYIVIRIVLLLFVVSNLFGCLFYYAGCISLDNNSTTNSWMRQIWGNTAILNLSWQQKYILSFFWAYTSTTQIGAGLLNPQNTNELLVTIS